MNSTEPVFPGPASGPFSASPEGRFPGNRFRRGGRRNWRTFFLRGVQAIVMVLALALFFGWVTELLWNALIPSIFHLRSIHFGEAFCLLILCRLLFGGFHPGGRRRRRPRCGPMRGGRRWNGEMKARFDAMTPDEREKFRAGMRRGPWQCRPSGTGEPAQ